MHRLAGDVEAEAYQDRNLSVWVDKAEIRTGQSVPGMINQGLEACRFIGLIMTPDYFQSDSGWTDAEWHAALHIDPDNRKARIIPLLVDDCPYIPVLLRHLNMIDFRGDRYSQALRELFRVLRDEPLPRPITYRGQLVTPGGRIDRGVLVSERSVVQADPDVVTEWLYCNLLPIEKLPQYIYTAPIAKTLCKTRKDGTEALPSKQEIKNTIRAAQEEAKVEHPFMPAFRIVEDRIVTFHDLESSDGVLASVIESEDMEIFSTAELLRDEDDRRLVVSLLNMAIDRHANRIGLVIDETKQGRFFFPPKEGNSNVITWIPRERRARRTVAKPCFGKDGQLQFWRHLGVYLRVLFITSKFFLKIVPTWVITEDGFRVKAGPKIGRFIIKWTGPERNMQVLYHVRFWTTILRTGPGRMISIRAGDQWMEASAVPAFVQQAYGIAYDNKDLMGLLDQEAPLIAQEEDNLADRAAEAEISQAWELIESVDGEELTTEVDEESDFHDIE